MQDGITEIRCKWWPESAWEKSSSLSRRSFKSVCTKVAFDNECTIATSKKQPHTHAQSRIMMTFKKSLNQILLGLFFILRTAWLFAAKRIFVGCRRRTIPLKPTKSAKKAVNLLVFATFILFSTQKTLWQLVFYRNKINHTKQQQHHAPLTILCETR